ncbi:Fructose-1 6-bisphosphatase class 1 1 [Bienertia sinuspersici]
MAAEVSRQIKSEAKSGLITRDFLGGCFGFESKELDLDLHVPNGWEKRLDLKSGKVYIQRSNPANSASEQKNCSSQISPKPNDSNTFPQSLPSSNLKPTLSPLEQPSLDLKLVPNNNNNPSSVYSSVCTLDKVKSALDRAERASPTSSSSSSTKRRWMMAVRSQSPSNSSSLSVGEDEKESSRLFNTVPSNQNEGLLVAAACPSCLLYVLISKNDPKCPKCNSAVHLPVMSKKPKIDLNISM